MYKEKLWKLFNANYSDKRFKTTWIDEIEDMLLLLRLFPAKQVGRNVVGTIEDFDLSISKMIQFELVSIIAFYMRFKSTNVYTWIYH